MPRKKNSNSIPWGTIAVVGGVLGVGYLAYSAYNNSLNAAAAAAQSAGSAASSAGSGVQSDYTGLASTANNLGAVPGNLVAALEAAINSAVPSAAAAPTPTASTAPGTSMAPKGSTVTQFIANSSASLAAKPQPASNPIVQNVLASISKAQAAGPITVLVGPTASATNVGASVTGNTAPNPYTPGSVNYTLYAQGKQTFKGGYTTPTGQLVSVYGS